MTKFFCYGTLKSGFGANSMLRQMDAVYLGEVTTAPQYQLYRVGGFPGMVVDEEKDGGVRGELYEITDETFEVLDRYEGAPSLFKREQIMLENGEKVTAYIFNQGIVGLERIEDGEWKGRND